jgi:hypothetical protein
MCLTLYSGKASSAAFVKRLSSINTVRTSAKHKTHTHFVRKNTHTFIFLLFFLRLLLLVRNVWILPSPIASAHHQQSSSNSSSCWIPPQKKATAHWGPFWGPRLTDKRFGRRLELGTWNGVAFCNRTSRAKVGTWNLEWGSVLQQNVTDGRTGRHSEFIYKIFPFITTR